MHRFIAPAATNAMTFVELSPEETHHLRHVLRLAVGAEVIVLTGRGEEWDGRVARLGRSNASVELVAARSPTAEPGVRVTLGMSLLTGSEMDAVVRDATMLGVTAIMPLTSQHVSVPKRAWQAHALERWQRIAVASTKQCRRAVLPIVTPVASFEHALTSATEQVRIVCVEPSQEAGVLPQQIPRPASALLCVGPEGGWSTAEIDLARRTGTYLMQCGSRTLRADVAPTVALSALWTVWGWT